jgi:hypothetical protein
MRWTITLFAVAISLAWAGADHGAGDDARAILDKAIKAHGGEETLTRFKATQLKSRGVIVENGDNLEFTQEVTFLVPNKYREVTEYNVAGKSYRSVSTFDGTKAAFEHNGEAKEVTEATTKIYATAAYRLRVGRLVPIKGKEYELSLLGETKIEGKPAVGIQVKSKGQPDINLYFDAKTHLLVKTEWRHLDGAGMEYMVERVITEYQKIDGIAVPKKYYINRDDKRWMEVELAEAKYLEKWDEGFFKTDK